MKVKFLLLTCTSLELFTAVDVSVYLLFLGQTTVATIAAIVFAKIIVFHFIIDHYNKKKLKINPLNSTHISCD